MRIVRHYIRLPYVLLAMSDALVGLAAIFLGAYIRLGGEIFATHLSSGWVQSRAYVFAGIMLFTLLTMGLYQGGLRAQPEGIAVRLIAAIGLGAVMLMLVFYLVPPVFMGRGVFIFALVFAFVGYVINRLIFYSSKGQDILKKRILVLGSGERAASITTQLRRRTDKCGFKLVGFLPMGGEVSAVEKKYLVGAGMGSLKGYVIKNDIDEIVVAVEDRRQEFPLGDLLDCKMDGIDIIDILTFFEREAGKVRLDLLHPSWMIFSDGFQQDLPREIIKRSFDIAAALGLLILGWPVMLLVTIAIVVESGGRGPVLYRQVRLGKNGKPFSVLKFRSMRTDAEKDGKAQWAGINDSRITRVGAFTRKFRLDEMPQILNILRGDMSFVGPRPERPEFVEELDKKNSYYGERHRIKPGLTGWAQLCYPYGSSENDAFEKLQYDLYYIKNQSLLLDVSILLQTVEVVLFRKGAR